MLEKTVRCTTSAVCDVFRARIVLLAAKGSQSRDIAAELDTGQDTVSKWRRRFVTLLPLPGSTRLGHCRNVVEDFHREAVQIRHLPRSRPLPSPSVR